MRESRFRITTIVALVLMLFAAPGLADGAEEAICGTTYDEEYWSYGENGPVYGPFHGGSAHHVGVSGWTTTELLNVRTHIEYATGLASDHKRYVVFAWHSGCGSEEP